MSSTEKVSESAPRVFRDKNYVVDEKLEIIPSGWDSARDPNELSRGPPAPFPSLKTFANLANVAYFNHSEDGIINDTSKNKVQLEGFTFLAAANNPGKLNGYFGVAYVNRDMRQVILSHRGTVLSTFGALFADLIGIVRKNFVPQVSSAITFAHKVVDYAAKHAFAVFFTGHSLGAWLAQITTFSTMYLTLDEVTGHFVGKQSPHSDVRMPYTVVFDSPGAFEFLCLLKKTLFPRHVESTQEISVEALPVEVFLFHPNPVNCVNHQIGRLFILDLQKVGVDKGRYFGALTHGIGPVLQLLSDLREEDAVKWRVIDFREGKKDFKPNSTDVRERTVPLDKSSVPLYFFSREERRFLEGAKRDFPPDGQFEGVDAADEETANYLVGVLNDEDLWELVGGEESVVKCGERDRREFIPRVRHIVRCLRQRGTLWWNPKRSQLPTNYVDRRMCPTQKLQEFTDLSEKKQEEQNEIKELSATEVMMKEARLVLFVDPPGMGKSSAMTQLEKQLRSEVSLSPRVIVRLNLNKVQDILQSEDAEKVTIAESAMRFIERFVANIRVTLLQETFPEKLLPLYVLMDGLDEVCPLYEQIMLRLLRRLLADAPQRLFRVHKVVLTTRPHLQKLIEDAFDVQANSLLPLKLKQQAEFLEKEVGLSFISYYLKSLKSLPLTAQDLMGNPLMLWLYAQVFKSQGTKAVVNIFDLYSQFVAAKHELYVVEKEEAEPAKMTTHRRVRSVLGDNLKFYFACAVHELLGSNAPDSELSHAPPGTFPRLVTFANLAKAAYFEHDEQGTIICPPKDEVKLDGFIFLAAANNTAFLNGYYAVAYVNREMKQVILSHRGTVICTFGALVADCGGICCRKFVPQVSSAITFAHKVVDYAAKQGFDVFFNGHSLGGWLAQITTFSTMYLTLDEGSSHFVAKESPHTVVQMPFTVVLDSPGACEILSRLKKNLFKRLEGSTQEINVETLPVEVFLFHPNYVNRIKNQIGRVFMLDVEKGGVDTGKYFGAGTHRIGPVVKLLSELEEKDAVRWRVTDFRKRKRKSGLFKYLPCRKCRWTPRDERERTAPWDRNTFPAYFFSKEERRFLEEVEKDYHPEGQFEGVNWKDEETANSLVGVTSENSLWKLTVGEESVMTSGGWDEREFIPRVRHTFRCLRQRGTLWWNPTRSLLPTNYVDRRMCPTGKLQEFTALSEIVHEEQNEIEELSATAVLMKKARLVLFVDPPGMGKSSAMTQLEMQLRSEVSLSPRVILRLNLNRVQDILQSEVEENETFAETAMRFMEQFVANIRVTRLQETFPGKLLPLYVLLDGLDEVCPDYEQIMLHLLRRLLADTPQRLFRVHKVILTTRPHLQKLIEDAFDVQANSLLPLHVIQQLVFLQKEVGLSLYAASESLNSLPDTARSLMGNPLMLSLYAQVLKSQGTEAVVNMFDLYSQFVAAKHELHVVEKEEAEPAKMSTRRRVTSMLDDNLKFYFACAVEELVGIRSIKTPSKAILGKRKASDLGAEFLEQPTGRKLDELISYGLLVSGGRFKHRSFAEFFYAQLLTLEANEYKQFREVLFGRMYENKVNENVERFVGEILLRRKVERRGRESPESFPEFCLRDEEAALFLGQERLKRLGKSWIDSQRHMDVVLGCLLIKMEKPYQSDYTGPLLTSPLQNVGGELAGAEDKESALRQFYNGPLFVFLCGSAVLLRLDYGQPDSFKSIKSNQRTFGLFWRWLCGLEDRSWVRAKVFGMNEESVAEGGGHLGEGSAEGIRMFAARTDDVSQFLSDVEISAALNSFDSVVDDNWRSVEDLEVEKVRRRLEKYVDPARLQRSLLTLLATVDHFLFNRWSYNDLEWSWWYAEVFSRSDVLSFVSPYASRVPNIPGFSWRAVQNTWGEELVTPCEEKTLLRIKEGDLGLLGNLCEEAERGGLKLEGDFMSAVREMIFGEKTGWEVLEMLERRLVRHVGTNDNSCLSQETNSATNLLQQLFQFEDVGTKILHTLGLPTNVPSDLEDIYDGGKGVFLLTSIKWLPFVVRYFGKPKTIKQITDRLSFYTKTLEEVNFTCAARCFFLAHSSEETGSSSVCQLIRVFLRGLKTEPDSLLNVLLDADERVLRTLIKQNSPGTPPTVTHTPLGPLLICLLNKNKSTSNEYKSTPPWGLTMDSSMDSTSVACIFTDLIETSPCCDLRRVLGNFHSSFSPDLLKEALLSETLYEYLQSKRRVHFRKYVWVNTERICRLRTTIRYYFVVFGEDLEWVEDKRNEYVDLLTWMPVEILSVLEVESTVEVFPPLQIELKLNMVKKLEKMLRDKIGKRVDLSWLAEQFSYVTKADWERLLQSLQLIPLQTDPTECTTAVVDHIHPYVDIVDSRLVLIRVWVKHFGAEETRRAADEEKLWEWLRKERVPRGEYLHVAVEVGSLEGVKTLGWPGLLKWRNKGGKTAGEVSVELWGPHHEISLFLEERFQAVKAFHEEP